MRRVALILLGTVAIAALPLPSQAVTPAPGHEAAAPSPNIVEVDRRCGAGRHYVRTHRNKQGHLIKGHCVRDHHH
jgi:hypothetical protein